MRRPTRPTAGIMAKVVGSRFRAFRKARRFTSIEISVASGVDVATISRIEHGKMLGTPDSHLRLALALGIRLSTLYRGLEDAVANHPATPDAAAARTVNGSDRPRKRQALLLAGPPS